MATSFELLGSRPLVLVTGAAGGLGREIADQFVANGCRVHACDVARDGLASLAERHGADRVRCSVADVGSAADVEALFRDVAAWGEPVAVLVNNVGIAGARGPVEEISRDAWNESIAVNFLGAAECMRRVIPAMRERRSGAIVNVSTSSVVTRPLQRGPYIVSKAALEALTFAAARELGSSGIRVNAVRPGMMDNARMQAVLQRVALAEGIEPAAVLARELAHVSMRTMVSMADVAALVVYLASDSARHLTGQALALDGGAEWEG